MSDCCEENQNKINCPITQQKGKPVRITTLQYLLKPEALLKLNTSFNYFFCDDENCSIVYFNEQGNFLKLEELRVPVFQKNRNQNVPVCYCFNWTRNRIYQEIKETGSCNAEKCIKEKIKAKLCACQVKNPQGSCCLVNVHQTIKDYQSKLNSVDISNN